MSRSVPFLQVIDGGREALERQYLWAVVFDRPEQHVLARRLTPSANDALRVARTEPGEAPDALRTDEPQA